MKDMKEILCQRILCFIHSQQNILVQGEIMRIKSMKSFQSLYSHCGMQPDADLGRYGQFFLVISPIRKKICITRINVLFDFVNAPSNCQSSCQYYSSSINQRSMDLFQAQVSSNLKCMSSLLWNSHSLWGSYCPHHFMNCAHGEYAFTCLSTCKFPGRLEYCCLLLYLHFPQ